MPKKNTRHHNEENFHKDNHFVPQFYLKSWESSPKKTWVYRTLVSHENVPIWNEMSRESIGFHTHLYTEIVSGKESDELENWFQNQFEVPAEIPIKKVINNDRLTKDDWFHLVRFLAAQDLRTPANLMEVTKRHEATIKNILDDTIEQSIKKLEKAHENKEKIVVKEHQSKRDFPFKVHYDKETGLVQAKAIVGRSSWLASTYHLLNNTVDILHQHKWTILKPAKGMTWFTTDKPVMKLNCYDLHNYDFKGGYARIGGEIFLPLSPYHMMYTIIGTRPPLRGTVLTKGLTLKIKKMFAENSFRIIFSEKPYPEIPQLRKRKINSIMYKKEQETWKNWNSEQSTLEAGLEEWKQNLTNT